MSDKTGTSVTFTGGYQRHVRENDLRVRVSSGSSTNPLDFGVLGLLAIEHLQPTHGRTAAYDALITSASSSTRACSPSSEHNPPTHLVATMPQLRDTRVTRLARARASTPSGTRMRGRTYSSTSQLRQGIPTVFTVRTCAQRSSSTTRPATAYGHTHNSDIYGYASPHGGATVRVSHRPVAPEACNTCSHHLFTSTPRHHRHLLRGRQPTR